MTLNETLQQLWAANAKRVTFAVTKDMQVEVICEQEFTSDSGHTKVLHASIGVTAERAATRLLKVIEHCGGVSNL